MKNSLKLFLIVFLNIFLISAIPQKAAKNIIFTVQGQTNAQNLGFTLTHEHLFSNFGKDPKETSQYDESALYKQVIPHLKKMKALGVNSIFDCTTAYFGRRTDILKTLADSAGLNIITNTGFYGAANDRYVPEFAFKAKPEEIAKIWIDEFNNGIGDSKIKPGFIKLAFDGGKPSEIDKKLFIAGILTHKQTGLTMAVHTGDNPEAIETQLQLLKEHQTNADALVIVHANAMKDMGIFIRAALEGAWISLDGVKANNTAEYLEKLKELKTRKLLHKVLLSHDGDLYTMDGSLREMTTLMEVLLPAMKDKDFTEVEIRQITVDNPQKAFGVQLN